MEDKNNAISKHLKEILQLAPKFSTDGRENPSMELREKLLLGLSVKIRAALSELQVSVELLGVKHGGRQYNYSPVAWIRIFDCEFSPTAQAGYYIVLLFAADGSAVYLSLNQGTSEIRGNQMRPISSEDDLIFRASEARDALKVSNIQINAKSLISINLKWANAPVKNYSKKRIKNYELANILAYRYASDEFPSDELFRADLAEMVLLLWNLEKHFSTKPTHFITELPQIKNNLILNPEKAKTV